MSIATTTANLVATLSKRAPMLVGAVRFIGYTIVFIVGCPIVLTFYAAVFALCMIVMPPLGTMNGLASLGGLGDYSRRDEFKAHWTSRGIDVVRRMAVAVWGPNSQYDNNQDTIYVAGMFGGLLYLGVIGALIIRHYGL